MAASKTAGLDGVAADLIAARRKGSYEPIEGYSGVKGFVLALPLTVGNIMMVLGRRGPRAERHILLGTITQQGVRRVRLGTASAVGHLRTWASPHARPVGTHGQEKVERLPEGRGLRVAALMNLIKVANATMARLGARLDARVRPHFGEVVIIYPRYDRPPIDRELNHAGMVKCDFRKHSATGASFDHHTAAQLRVMGELDDGVPM